MLERRLLSYQPGLREGQEALRNSSQGVFVPPGIVKICTFFASVLLLQSCAPQLSWKESYLHRQWERAFLTAQSQYQDGNYKDAGKSYLEAITYANQMESDANKDAAVKTGLANCYFKLNAANKAEGRFGEAIAILRQHLKQTLTPSERRISTENLEHTLLEQGKFHYAQEEYKKADAEFSEARKLLDGLSVGNRDIEAEYTESRERAILLAYTFNNQQKLGQYSDAQNTADLILSEKLRYAIPAKLLEDIEKKAVNSLNNNGKKEEAEKLHS